MSTSVLKVLGNNIALNQVKCPITRDIHKTLKIFYTKGGTHQKTFKLMKDIGSSNIIIGDFSNPTNPDHALYANL